MPSGRFFGIHWYQDLVTTKHRQSPGWVVSREFGGTGHGQTLCLGLIQQALRFIVDTTHRIHTGVLHYRISAVGYLSYLDGWVVRFGQRGQCICAGH